MNTISWSDFEKIEILTGTVTEAKPFPEARKPAYKLTIDFGDGFGIRQASAQISELYRAEELVGKQVICVVNFPPKQIGPFISQCLVTGLYREDGSVVLAVPDRPVQNGARLG